MSDIDEEPEPVDEQNCWCSYCEQWYRGEEMESIERELCVSCMVDILFEHGLRYERIKQIAVHAKAVKRHLLFGADNNALSEIEALLAYMGVK